jgi:hypothetical protein
MPPPDEATRRLARQEARTILQVVRNELERHRIDVGILQLVGTYPIEGQGAADVDVVQVVYSKSAIEAPVPSIARMFEAPPATEVQCLNPSFA